jgi:flagellar basal body rod protein FlgG
MIRGFYSSASGLTSQQTSMNVIANNMANISTTGFKPQQANFSALIYESINGGGGNLVQTGHGTKIETTPINFAQGGLNKTDQPMDFAIVGDGFFSTKGKTDDANTYTRDGSFHLSVEGTETYLVNSKGNYILDGSGNQIKIEEAGLDAAIIGVYTFANKFGLKLVGGSQYQETTISGEATALNTATLKAEFLENSGVDVSVEMVKMMEASKGFSFNAKLLQTADEMEKIINQLR